MHTIHRICAAYLVFGASMFVPQSPFEFVMPALPQVIGSKFHHGRRQCVFQAVGSAKFSAKYGNTSWIFVNWPFLSSRASCSSISHTTIFSYLTNSGSWASCSIVGLFSNFNDQHGNIENVISPNTLERTRIISIGSLIYNLSFHRRHCPARRGRSDGGCDASLLPDFHSADDADVSPCACFSRSRCGTGSSSTTGNGHRFQARH